MSYWLHIYTLFCIFGAAAVSLNFFVKRTGYLTIASAGFFGLGAYINALMLSSFTLPIVISVILSGLSGALVSYALSTLVFRARGDYFVVLTLALQQLIFLFFLNASEITNGPLGISDIRPLNFQKYGFAAAAIIWTLLLSAVFFSFSMLERTNYAKLLSAIGEDEMLLKSFGYNSASLKAIAFSVSCGVCATFGALYAQYMQYIDPYQFTVDLSIYILSMVILAGGASSRGVLSAAAFIVFVPELLRFTGLGFYAANIKEVIYGVAICGAVLSFSYLRKNETSALN